MSEIFKYTDPDNDTLEAGWIETDADGRRGWVYIGAGAETVHLPPAEVTRLRASLAPFDPEYLAQTEYREGYAAGQRAADDAPATEIEVGREYRLRPDVHNVRVKSAINGHGVTRVRVVKGPNQGDYRVEALDGDIAGQDWYWVAARFLAPLEPALVDDARYQQGYDSGFADGQAGLAEAKQDAYEQGKREGFAEGHKAGAEDALEGARPQEVDIDSPEAARLLAEGKYVTTDDSFPLDARRLAALERAHTLLTESGADDVDVDVVLDYAVFLLGEAQ